jgi:CheY-specific phosphatase CheX
MTSTGQLILDLTEQEAKAVLLQLAGGARGREVQDATAAEISEVLAKTGA